MRIFFNNAIVIQLIATLLTMSMALFLFYQLSKGKKRALLYSYLSCQSLLFIWALTELLEAWTINESSKWLIYQVQFFPVCFIGFCWLILCLYYTEHRFVTVRRHIVWLFIPCFLLYLLMLTNAFHHLFFTVFEYDREEYGIAFWLNAALAYSYVFAGSVFLLHCSFQRYHTAKMLFILLVFAAVIPVVANILFLAKIVNLTYELTPIAYDITPTTFSITVTLFTIAITRYRFLNIMPLALWEIVYNMKESILVLDSSLHIVNYNAKFYDNFIPNKPGSRFEDLNDVIAAFKARGAHWAGTGRDAEDMYRVLRDNATEAVCAELLINNDQEYRFYTVDIRPVLSKQGLAVGHIISLNDVTTDKMLFNELNRKNGELEIMNRELLTLNRQLEDSAALVKELAVAAERSRFARDAHDTLGNMMALLIKMLEASAASCREHAPETEGQLREAIQVARDGLKELRRSMFGLIPEKLENNGLSIVLAGLASEFRALGLKIDLSIEELPPDVAPAFTFVLYKICQEALTNTWRHGSAENVTIILKVCEHLIRLIIIDDGRGSRMIKKGFGLSGMEQRVRSLNGAISFYSDGEIGFTIKVEIPRG